VHPQTHLGVMKVRELLKQFGIIVYTGSILDDLVMMDLELDDLYEEKHVEAEEFRELKMALRRAYREAGGE
jgi:uncharacterized protein YqgQ